MKGETVNVAWLGGLWPTSRKSAAEDKDGIGIMSFEVAGLMSKVVNLWHSLSDRGVVNLREWILNSVGVKVLVSNDEYFLMELAWNEILNNFESIAKSVARLSKRCKDPIYHAYESFVSNPDLNYLQWSDWEYKWKKMEKKVKKMETFVVAMSLLSQELEVLAERERTFKRMQLNRETNKSKLLEFHKKVVWQRQQVQNLRSLSPWNRSYDYIVRLLVRSLFTILGRIIILFGNSHLPNEKQQSVSPTMMNTSNNHLTRHSSFPIGSKPVLNKSKKKKKEQQVLHSQASSERHQHHSKGKQLKYVGSFKGCISMSTGNDSPVVQGCLPANGGSMRFSGSDYPEKNIDVEMKKVDKYSLFHRSRVQLKLSFKGRLKPAPSTLGDAGLALHYANVIVLIEKIVSASQTINLQTRDDLYNRLPTTIRTALRGKLKWYAKCKHAKVHDGADVAIEWSLVLSKILEWLAPLAHNMVRWHSERSFEKEHTTLKANVLLVQTLYFADQTKTEAAIVQLLVGLHYVCGIGKEDRMRNRQEFAASRY